MLPSHTNKMTQTVPKLFLKIFFLLVAMSFWHLSIGQSERIKELEDAMRGATGAKRVNTLIDISKAYQTEGSFSNAEKKAHEAANYAQSIKESALQAQALNQEGAALLMRNRKRNAGSRFKQSLSILEDLNNADNKLILDNLKNLRTLGRSASSQKELETFDARIALLTLKKQSAVAKNTYQENTAAYEAEIAAREDEINRMTESQKTTAMLLLQQKSVLDSVRNRAQLDSLTLSNASLALQEAQSTRNFQYAIIGVLFLLVLGATYSFVQARQNAKVLEEKNKTIREEQSRSDALLLNILPSLVAAELKEFGRTKAQYFEDVSVLFADFVGFTKITELLSPQQLVSELDTCFQKFDEIIAHHGLEKIKTIGDAYMCAGGVPNGGGAQARRMVQAAFDMQNWLASWNIDRDKKGLPRFDARIGIHQGPVVAGVVGSKKFAFDIWGDTVNVAARIEQAGEGGRINISGATYAIIKDNFQCVYRGKIAAKNKGEIDMYYVES